MDVIKFRAKSLNGGKWLFGSHYDDGGEDYILPNNLASALDYEDYQVDQNTIGQFTGITDKNGKEIYEGDILTDSWVDFSRKAAYLTVVKFKDGAFGFDLHFEGFTPMQQLITDSMKFEVIGNIHDNPELLNEKDDDEDDET